jgi:hypothetical protein
MNRYEREVAEMDRSRAWRIRILSITGAAMLFTVALWSAGIPNVNWFPWLAEPMTLAEKSAEAPRTGPAEPVTPRPVHASGRLRLFSTAPGRNAREGAAQIGFDVANPVTVAAGGMLENGTVLAEVYADRVMVERDGESTVLYAEGIATHPGQKTVKANESLLVMTEPRPPTAPPAPDTYVDLLRAAPRFDGEQIVGFEVYPGTTRTHFDRFGLRPGDVLTLIDGAPVATVDVLYAALKDISEGRSVVVAGMRGNQQFTLSLESAPEESRERVAGAHAPPSL